jgi:2'-5' RNA ligase
MIAMTTCFLALIPDEAFANAVLSYKRRTRQRIGPQLYLSDPPHLTLYLASFPNPVALGSAVQKAIRGLPAPTAQICGWHVFRDDPLNGNHTLVCDTDPQHRRDLAICQEHICTAVSCLRDSPSTLARYVSSQRRLSEAAQANLTQWGFPFVGSIWHPHVTIASIRPADWDAIWPELKNDPPGGTVRFPKLCLYSLKHGKPVLLESFHLESMS